MSPGDHLRAALLPHQIGAIRRGMADRRQEEAAFQVFKRGDEADLPPLPVTGLAGLEYIVRHEFS
jgi:hypothetical protein